MANALIPVFAGNIADTTTQLCDARALHAFLQVKRDFSNWIKGRIRKFKFAAGEDYLLAKSGEQVPHQGGTRTVERIDYHLTVGMAKELSMVENNDQGRAARRYFIACEKQALAQQLPTAPYAVQPTDKLNAAQQTTLRTLLESNAKRLPHAKQADAMIKGWSKLKSHFGVAYRDIPAHEFTEAVSIISRHISALELVGDTHKANPMTPTPQHLSADRTRAAFDVATRAAGEVQRTVFDSVMNGTDAWKHQRLLLAFTDSAAPAYVQPIESGCFVATWQRLTADIRSGECLHTTAELLDMASACMQRMQRRSQPAIAI